MNGQSCPIEIAAHARKSSSNDPHLEPRPLVLRIPGPLSSPDRNPPRRNPSRRHVHPVWLSHDPLRPRRRLLPQRSTRQIKRHLQPPGPRRRRRGRARFDSSTSASAPAQDGLQRLSLRPQSAGAELLDACDELGMLVMDEARNFGSSPGHLSQLQTMVRRDRNHPGVILWSICNEEAIQGAPAGAAIAHRPCRIRQTARPGPARDGQRQWRDSQR